MNLEIVRDIWERKAKATPVASMLSADLCHVTSVSELFEYSQRDIDNQMQHVRTLAVDLPHKRALDFGCGLGRTTQALARHFDEVDGIDIAPSFIELAKKYNRHADRCRYHVNERDDLGMFSENCFDLIWCYGVFQVLEPRYCASYIREFFRVLAPGGLVVFHQTTRPGVTFKGLILRTVPKTLRNLYYKRRYGFEVHGMSRRSVIDLIRSSGGTLLQVEHERQTPGPNWLSFRVLCQQVDLLYSPPGTRCYGSEIR